nr:immunoglobulin heavy chain junction region [Mus musculus]
CARGDHYYGSSYYW